MRIRVLPLVIGGAALVWNALGQSPETNPSLPAPGMATLSLSELKALWEKAQEKPPIPPPAHEPLVPAMLQELTMEITLHPERCTGVVRATAVALKDGWHEVPLFGGDLAIDSATAESVVLASAEGYSLLLKEDGTQQVDLQVSMVGTSQWTEEDRPTIQLSLCTFRKVLFKGVPDGMVLVDCERVYAPSAEGEVLLACRPTMKSLVLQLRPAKRETTPAIGIELAQAMVLLMKCSQRIVMDGGLLTETEFTLKHQSATKLVISLPEGADLLRCMIDGAPVRPERRENEILLEVPAQKDHDGVTGLLLTTFIKLNPIQQTSGSMKLSVPVISLFHERLDWLVVLPEGITATALESNATSSAAVQGSRELQLKRELWKGDPVTAEVFYQKQKP
jgi:hypothetical protein